MTKYDILNNGLDKSGDCWIWTGKDNGNGYGYIYFDHKQHKCHRLAYEQAYGEIKDNLCVLHKCDNRRCCNPAHLFLGTYKDNAVDRQNKGRTVIPDNRGENCGTSKLTNDQVIAIRAITNTLQKDIAAQFGVSVQLVSLIRNRRIWKHI